MPDRCIDIQFEPVGAVAALCPWQVLRKLRQPVPEAAAEGRTPKLWWAYVVPVVLALWALLCSAWEPLEMSEDISRCVWSARSRLLNVYRYSNLLYIPFDLLMRNKLPMVAGNSTFIEGVDISNLPPFCVQVGRSPIPWLKVNVEVCEVSILVFDLLSISDLRDRENFKKKKHSVGQLGTSRIFGVSPILKHRYFTKSPSR